jgi:hypothetical protein
MATAPRKKRNPKDATDSVEAKRRKAVEARIMRHIKDIRSITSTTWEQVINLAFALGDVQARVTAIDGKGFFDRLQRKREAGK